MLKTTIKSPPEKHNLTWIEMRFVLLVKRKRANEKAGHSILPVSTSGKQHVFQQNDSKSFHETSETLPYEQLMRFTEEPKLESCLRNNTAYSREASFSLSNQLFNRCRFNKWRFRKSFTIYKRTETGR